MKLPPIKRPNRKKRVHCTKYQESKYATRFSTNLILHAANKTKETFQLPENKFWKYFLFGWPIVIIPSFLKKIRKSLCGLKLFVKTSNSCMMVNFFFPALHIALKNRDTRTGLQRLVIPACTSDHQGTILDLDRKVILFSTYPIIPGYDLLKLLPAFSQCFSSQQLSVVVIVDNWSGLELGQPVKIKKKAEVDCNEEQHMIHCST